MLIVGLMAFLFSPLVIPVTRTEADLVQRDFEEACRRSGVTLDQVARMQGITAPQLSRQLSGLEHLSVARFYKMRSDEQGKRFLWAYVLVLAKAWLLPEADLLFRLCELARSVDLREVLRDTFLGIANTAQKHMARAQLSERDHNKEGVA